MVRVAPLLALLLAACAPQAAVRPTDTQPANPALASVRADLLATAAERYGAKRLAEAQAAPTHLIAKRFVGMAPPPPPGAAPDWRPLARSALLVKGPAGWKAATATGWRAVNAEASARIDAALADPRLWSEEAITPPCPDYGSSNLLLVVPGRGETVRQAQCTSAAATLALAALDG